MQILGIGCFMYFVFFWFLTISVHTSHSLFHDFIYLILRLRTRYLPGPQGS
jgi:hypothetical protein